MQRLIGLRCKVAVDRDQNAYVTGETSAPFVPNVPLIPPRVPPLPFCGFHGFQNASTFGGLTDAFVAKIDATGSSFLYCSYLGGNGEDLGYGIAVDTSANAYVTGLAYSTDFPVTASALQNSYAGAGDSFLTKVNTNAVGAASLAYSTYLGGNGLDQGKGIIVDSSDKVYIAGLTTSTASKLGFTPPTGAFQPDCKLDSQSVCEGDAFVAKLDPSASGAASLLYFTYLGGSLADGATGIAVDPSGNFYITGSTVSTDFPIAPSPDRIPQSKFGGGNADAFVTEFDPTGASLIYSTYLGGTNTDTGAGIAVDTDSPASVYVAGQTCSPDFPLANPVQTTGVGSCDAFVSKVSTLEGVLVYPSGLVFPTQNIGTTSQPLTVTITNGDNPQTITTVAITGPDAGSFAQTNTCVTSLVPGAQCTITVTFKPTNPGVRRASITVTDSAPGSPQVIPLTGSTSTVGLSASSLSFGSQPVGVKSDAQTVTVTNNGTTALTISGIAASGDFAETNNCSVPLQATTTCVISVTYTPSTPGSSVGALTINDNAAGSPQVLLLTGTGLLQPIASLSTTGGSHQQRLSSAKHRQHGGQRRLHTDQYVRLSSRGEGQLHN